MLFDFDAFEKDFRTSCVNGIRLLAQRYNTAPFYAISIWADALNGDFGLCANTEEDFSRTLQEYLAKYPTHYVTPLAVKSLRYSCGDWAFQSFWSPEDFKACVSELLDEWGMQAHSLAFKEGGFSTADFQRFEEIACRIASSPEVVTKLAELQRTDDFLVTVTSHDEPSLASVYRPMWYESSRSLDGFDPMAFADNE